MVALVGEVLETICAFCFMTSAGVRIAHDTSSAREEAVEWMKGAGTKPSGRLAVDGLRWFRSDFVRS